MVRSNVSHVLWAASLVGFVFAVGCTKSTSSPAAVCGDGLSVSNGCAGVPQASVCDGDACTQGVTCSATLAANSDATLADATSKASAGGCIVVAPGAYGLVTLPGGVSLLGKGSTSVSVQGVTMQAGSGAVLRGVTVGSGGVVVEKGTASARIESVLVKDAASTGITLGAGTEITIVTTTIVHAGAGDAGYGILSASSGKLTLDRVHVDAPRGPGIWMQACDDGCTCAGTAVMKAHGIIIEGAELVAFALAGVDATLDDVKIDKSVPFHKDLQQGGGLAAYQCTKLAATNLRATSNASYGVFIDHSSGSIGGDGAAASEISNNGVHGIFIQNVAKMPNGDPQEFTLTGAKLAGNAGVALGLHASKGIIIEGCEATGTQSKTLPVIVGNTNPGLASIADGLSWTGGTSATIKSLVLDGNARSAGMIAGQWGEGSSANLTVKRPGFLGGIIIEGIPLDGATMPGMDNIPASLVSRDASFSQPFARGPSAPLPL
jgi:hypothetical protein